MTDDLGNALSHGPESGFSRTSSPHIQQQQPAPLPAENESNDVDSGDADDDNDGDAASVHSETSTIVYEQEPFETFQHKVVTLAQNIWHVEREDVLVTRMQGGSSNRIVGLGIMANRMPDSASQDVERILRIPRLEDVNIERYVATQRFVRQMTEIPTVDLELVDLKAANAIERPYMLMNRLAGTNLAIAWDDLTSERKSKVAKELGSIYRQMLSARTEAGGFLTLKEEEFHVHPLYVFDNALDAEQDDGTAVSAETSPVRFVGRPNDHDGVHGSLGPIQTVAETLKSVLKQHIAHLEKRFLGEPWCWDAWTRLLEMATQLEADGWLTDTFWCLNHLDLMPRNIHINTKRDPEGILLNGVLDWDTAVLGPNFVACRPPYWLWREFDSQTESEDNEQEPTLYDEPASPEKRKLKAIFEEAAGPEYVRCAYHPAYRLARRLFYFIIFGVYQIWAIKGCNAMIDEWNAFREASAPN